MSDCSFAGPSNRPERQSPQHEAQQPRRQQQQSGEETDSDVERLFNGLYLEEKEGGHRRDEGVVEESSAEYSLRLASVKTGDPKDEPGAYVPREIPSSPEVQDALEPPASPATTVKNHHAQQQTGVKKSTGNISQKERKTAADGKTKNAAFDFCRAALSAQQRIPTADALSKLLPPRHIVAVDSVMERVVNDWDPPETERQMRRQLLLRLESDVRRIFPHSNLHVFGSSVNGFEFADSDLDVTIATPRRVPCGDAVKYLAQYLASIPYWYENVDYVSECRVPIVRLKLRTGKPDVPSVAADISFGNLLGVRNSAMLRRYAAIDWRVKYLGYTVKLFAKMTSAADASCGGLSSYAYLLLVIYFLQQCSPPVVPILQELTDPRRPLIRREFEYDGADTYFFDGSDDDLRRLWPWLGANVRSRGELYFDFLRFYLETFDYEKLVVCIRRRSPISRSQKRWNRHFLAIEDPFDLSHNLGAVLTKETLVYIFKSWHKAFSLFSSPMASWPLSTSPASASSSRSSLSPLLSSSSASSPSTSSSPALSSEKEGDGGDPGPSSKTVALSRQYPTPAHYLLNPDMYVKCDRCGELGCDVGQEEEEEEWPELSREKKGGRTRGFCCRAGDKDDHRRADDESAKSVETTYEREGETYEREGENVNAEDHAARVELEEIRVVEVIQLPTTGGEEDGLKTSSEGDAGPNECREDGTESPKSAEESNEAGSLTSRESFIGSFV